MNTNLKLDLSMLTDEGLRAIEEILLTEFENLRELDDDGRYQRLGDELRKLEDYFSQ